MNHRLVRHEDKEYRGTCNSKRSHALPQNQLGSEQGRNFDLLRRGFCSVKFEEGFMMIATLTSNHEDDGI